MPYAPESTPAMSSRLKCSSHTELWENVFDRDGTTISVYYELSKDENGINGIHLSMIVKDVSFQEPPFWERIWKSIRARLPV